MCVRVCKRERERQRETERQRELERQRGTERERVLTKVDKHSSPAVV